MSAKVDVLAVMDASISAMCSQCCGEGVIAGELEQARAAVAELIEAAKQANEELYRSDDASRFNQLRDAWARLDETLANIGPQS